MNPVHTSSVRPSIMGESRWHPHPQLLCILTCGTLSLQNPRREPGCPPFSHSEDVYNYIGRRYNPKTYRVCVFGSNKHLHVQVMDDTKMHTLASCSTMQKTISDLFDYTFAPTIDVAKKVGKVIAKSCVEKGITMVAFDRGGYPYQGRVKALADAAQERGIQV